MCRTRAKKPTPNERRGQRKKGEGAVESQIRGDGKTSRMGLTVAGIGIDYGAMKRGKRERKEGGREESGSSAGVSEVEG